MTADEILLAAVEKQTPAERAAYLDGACGPDAALRALVEGLLKAHEAAGSFLEQPLFEPTPTVDQPPDPEKPGTVIGLYKLLQQIGEGGMGTVFMAEQTQPVRRKVALKVIKPGMDSRQVIARFEAERQALALMDHVNIARVLDAGTTESSRHTPCAVADDEAAGDGTRSVPATLGRPYFVMELVHGVPITRYCDDHRLTPRQRLELFVPVCQAVQHAHQKGIIHRDVKPSNVLVTLYDGKPVPKVIDFGVAKATEQKLTERTLFTQYGTLVGTLEYMSPEQAEMSALGADTRSDIYSLGVLLYELLTGSTPLSSKRLKEAAYSEVLRMIKEEEPPRPSTRLSDSGEALASISTNRHTEPAKLTKLVRGELDWIVMKALEKDRNRRYETAKDFAADVQRYLADEPVLACPPSAMYRFRKFARRNKRALAMVAVVAAAALCLIVATLVHNARLGVALQDAQTNLDKARLAEEQARLAEQEKIRQRVFVAIAHLREAQARRNSGLMGRRFDSLEALKKAAEQFRALGPLDDNQTLELRNEAIACLALADLKPGKKWTPEPGWSRPYGFDPTWQHYVVRSAADDHPEKPDVRQGDLSVRRVADDQEIARLPGFGIRVTTWTQFSPDGRYLAAHYEWGQRHNYVWDLRRREAIVKVPHGTHEGRLVFSPDSRLVALPQPDKESIRIWELPSGTKWKDLPSGPPVQRVQFHPDGRQLTVVSGSIVQLRDLEGGKELATFQHPGDVATVAWRSDGKVFATGCFDSDIYLWDVANSAQPLRILKGHFGQVVHLAFSHGGDLLFSTSWDSTDRLWDPMTGQQLVSRPGGLYREYRFGPDDQGLDDGWQVATGRECRTFHAPKALKWVAISPSGRLMASARNDGVQLWDLAAAREGDKELATLPVGYGERVHFDPQGESLITAGKSAGLQRWPIAPDPETGGLRIGPPQSLGLSARAPLVWPGYTPEFALSADGRTIAYGPQHGRALLFDLEAPRRKLLIESPRLRLTAFSPDGRWLATGNWHGKGVKVWGAQTGKLAHDFDLGQSEDGTAWPAFSPDGKWLVTGTYAEYRFWEVGSWQKKHGLPRANAGNSLGWIVFSPDGKMVALLHSVSEVRLVDPATGRQFARLPTAGSPYCFSPDGSQLVTGAGRDGAFQVWDLRLIRRQLKEMGLDWDLPPYPPPPSESAKPLRVKVLAAEPPPPSKELDAQAYLERGVLYVQLRRYADATADFNRASTLDPKRPPWEQMAAAFEQATRLKADCPLAWYYLALLPLQRGDRAEYRKACATMLERFGESPSADAAYWTAWSCVLAPDAVANWTKPLQLAEKAHADDGKSYEKISTLGAVLYRAGRFKEAAQRLAEAEAAFQRTPSTRVTIVYNWLFQAMAHHRLGHAAEAASWLEKAVQEIDEPSPKTAQDPNTKNWNRRLTLQLLRREAEELLAKKSK